MFILRCYKHSFAHLHDQQFQCVMMCSRRRDKSQNLTSIREERTFEYLESSGFDDDMMIHAAMKELTESTTMTKSNAASFLASQKEEEEEEEEKKQGGGCEERDTMLTGKEKRNDAKK